MPKNNEVQVRWADGRIETFPWDIAWEKFHEDKDAWKISWTSPNGKRLRVAKIDKIFNLLKAAYIEDLIKEAQEPYDAEEEI